MKVKYIYDISTFNYELNVQIELIIIFKYNLNINHMNRDSYRFFFRKIGTSGKNNIILLFNIKIILK